MKIDTTVDKHGTDIIGEDEYGMWMGTDDQPINIDFIPRGMKRRCKRWKVYGYFRAQEFTAVVLAPDRERVEDYFLGLRVKDMMIIQEGKPRDYH